MISSGVGSGPDEMLGSPQLTFITILTLWIAVITNALAQQPSSPGPAPLEHGLEIIDTGLSAPQHLDLDQALQVLKIPSVSIALIDRGEVGWARAYGGSGASTRTLYQAASLSKLVAAVAAMRLVQQGRLDLDGNVNAALSSWHIPDSALTRGHPLPCAGF